MVASGGETPEGVFDGVAQSRERLIHGRDRGTEYALCCDNDRMSGFSDI